MSKDKGILDDLAYRRGRLYRPESSDDNAKKSNASKSSKEGFNRLAYGYRKHHKYQYKPLEISEQIRIAQELPQAVIKVTKYGKGASKINAHIKYISRKYTLELEDQDGIKYSTQESLENIVETWSEIYFDFKDDSTQKRTPRDTVHMVFSVPPCSDRKAFRDATSELLKDEFEGRNDYLFVEHADTEHPHIHAVIVLRTIQGKKLNPRKEYLHYLRKKYAEFCREKGIEVEASRRFERGLSGSSLNSKMTQMRKSRGIIPEADGRLVNAVKTDYSNIKSARSKKRSARNRSMRSHFLNTAKNLYEKAKQAVGQDEVQRLASTSKLLHDFAQQMPSEPTLPELLLEKVSQKQELNPVNAREILSQKQSSRHKDDKDLDVDR